MSNEDEARLQWLKANPTKTYNDLPQGLWDEGRIASEVARQNAPQQLGSLGGGKFETKPWPFPPFQE